MRLKPPLWAIMTLLLSMLLISNLSTSNLAQTQPPCEPPPGLGANWVWKAGVTVNLYIDPNFGIGGQDVIANQISSWNIATGRNVNFQVKTTAQGMGSGSVNGDAITWFIWKRIPPDLGAGAQGQTLGFPYEGKRGDTTTSINPFVTIALAQVASHEVGHTFGLNECYTCSANSSAMTIPTSSSINALGGYEGPTQCDVCAVARNLLSLPTSVCTPSPTPTPTPPPNNENDCRNTGGFWNFQYPGCFPEPQSCAGHCVPYWPLEAGGCEFALDYCGFQWGCPFGLTDGGAGCCCGPTPIVIDLAGNGFDLSNARNGVYFDMGGDGHSEPIAWTTADSDDAWLVLDRNGNGVIDSAKEMFGNFTDQPHATDTLNGFVALAEFDRSDQGGNNDGSITTADEIFTRLRLWLDQNHNGVSEEGELYTLDSQAIASIELKYRSSKLTDKNGNRFALRAKVKDIHGAQIGRWAWDVTLDVNPPPQ